MEAAEATVAAVEAAVVSAAFLERVRPEIRYDDECSFGGDGGSGGCGSDGGGGCGTYVMANPAAAAETGVENPSDPPPSACAGCSTGARGTIHTMSPCNTPRPLRP